MFRSKKKATRFSAGDSARLLKSYRDKKIVGLKHRQKNAGSVFSKILYWSSFFAFVGSAVYALFFSTFLSLNSINFSGNQEIDPGLMRESVEAEISGKYLNLVSKNNLILVRKDKIKKILLERFKRIEDVKIKKIFPDSLEISIAERELMLIMCAGERCYFIDDNGKAYGEADPSFLEQEKMDLAVLHDESGKPINLNDSVIPVDFLNFISIIKNKLKQELDIETERDFRTPRIVSEDVKVKTREGWEIYFNQGIGAQKEIDMLKAVLEHEIEKEKRKELEYVDLRTNNKVYYKFKTTEQSEAPVEEPKKDGEKKKS